MLITGSTDTWAARFLHGFVLLFLVFTASVAVADDYPKPEDCNEVKLPNEKNNKAGHFKLHNFTSHPIVFKEVIDCEHMQKWGAAKVGYDDGWQSCSDTIGMGNLSNLMPGKVTDKIEILHDDHATGGHAVKYAIKNYNGKGGDFVFYIVVTRKHVDSWGDQSSSLNWKVTDTLGGKSSPNRISMMELVKKYGIYFSAGWNWNDINDDEAGPSKSGHDDAYNITVAELPTTCKHIGSIKIAQPAGCMKGDTCGNSDRYSDFSSCKDFKDQLYCSYTDH